MRYHSETSTVDRSSRTPRVLIFLHRMIFSFSFSFFLFFFSRFHTDLVLYTAEWSVVVEGG